MDAPDLDDEDEQDYLQHGHPMLYHAAALDAEVGEEGRGWYDESEEHTILETEEASEESAVDGPPVRRHESTSALYGTTLSAEATTQLVPAGEGGLIWHAQVLADGYTRSKCCRPDGTIKPRRPMPHVFATDFFSSLSVSSDGRWCFTGLLNGCDRRAARTPRTHSGAT